MIVQPDTGVKPGVLAVSILKGRTAASADAPLDPST